MREIKKGVYWVGAIDWDLRNFHGYLTQAGSTYNAYLIVDEKIALVDTVKSAFTSQMLEAIRQIVDPAKIDYVVANHVEMDHSGGLPELMEVARNATILTSPNGEKGLKRHFKKDWSFQVVKTAETISLGKKTLTFFLMPMVHWPDSMATYIHEEKLLLPNDAFGQHIASRERFDDEIGWDMVKKEAAKYYVNIVMPYGLQVANALEALRSLAIDMIGPSHGVILRSHIKDMLHCYQQWANNKTQTKMVIVYDTMWGSTLQMAKAIGRACESQGIAYVMRNLATNHISDIMTDVLDAQYIAVGSPTLNNGMLPTVASFLTYLEGLAPQGRVGIAFGSYGWGGQAVDKIEQVFDKCRWKVPLRGLKLHYIPDSSELEEFTKQVQGILSFAQPGK